jgi:hypothetical protein
MPGKRITDNSVLMKQKVWALLRYSDGSEFCFQTTLCPDILRELGIVLEEGKLVRLDKQYYWNGRFIYRQFPYENCSITLWDSLTYTHRASYELHEFM